MTITMNLERVLVSGLFSLLASVCYAQDAKSPSPEKRDAESSSPAKAGAKSASPATEAAKPAPAGDGARLYREYCQACHIADGKGATGAGTYPALAKNQKMAAAPYPIIMILFGKAGMPWFNGLLTPEEIAAIVGHVRTNFGNNYAEPVTAKDVTTLTGPVPKDE